MARSPRSLPDAAAATATPPAAGAVEPASAPAPRRRRATGRPPPPAGDPAPGSAVASVDTSYLETLMGYNARRAALTIIARFLQVMAVYGLRPVDFSILSVIAHNPGVTSRQLCAALGILPPNLVGKLNALQRRGIITRHPHPTDGRAVGLHLTDAGHALMRQAECSATQLETDVTHRLSAAERRTLIRLLQKIYL